VCVCVCVCVCVRAHALSLIYLQVQVSDSHVWSNSGMIIVGSTLWDMEKSYLSRTNCTGGAI
jgi:hypothetical protein